MIENIETTQVAELFEDLSDEALDRDDNRICIPATRHAD